MDVPVITDHPAGSPPTVSLLVAAAMLATGLAAIVGDSPAWTHAVALERDRVGPLALLGHVVLHEHPAPLLMNVILLLTFGVAVESRLGAALHAGLLAACAAGSALGWSLLGSAPTYAGATGPALGVLTAFVVLFPRTGVTVPLPRITTGERVGWGLTLALGAIALLFGSVPWWLCAAAFVALGVARLHDSHRRWTAAGDGETSALFDAVTAVAPAWLVVPVIVLVHVGLVLLGLVADPGVGAGAALAAGLAALALSCSGLVRGTHEHPTLAELVGVRPRPARREWRPRGRLPWDPSLPPPGAADDR